MQDTAEFTYLTLPPSAALRSCIGLVVAGLAARARIGVGGLEEAVDLLEAHHAPAGTTRYRFSIKDEGLLAEVEVRSAVSVPSAQREDAWRTVVELVA